MRLRRADRVPADVLAALGLEPGERVLTGARDALGSWVVATDRALRRGALRVGWWEIAHARWYAEQGALAVEAVAGASVPGDPGSWRWELPDPGRLPETVHERVMTSIVLTRTAAVPGGQVRVVARRDAAADGLRWQVLADPGVDLSDPDVRRRADEALVRARAELG